MITFREIVLDDAEMILNWRTSQRVTRFMNSDLPYDLDAQRNWLAGCYDKDNYYHWLIQHGETPIGLINLADYDRLARRTAWGFYIGDDAHLGYGGFVPPHFYNFAFSELGVDVIDAEVFSQNDKVIKLHRLQGYRPQPERDRVIEKNGEEIKLIALTLHRDDWDFHKYRRFRAEFPMTRWQCAPESQA